MGKRALALRIASLLGILLATGALVFSVWILIETFVYEQTVPGYPSLIIGIMVIGGVQLLMIGVMGEYIGKVLSELKRRPVYFVAEHSVKRAAEAGAPGAAEAARARATVRCPDQTETSAKWLPMMFVRCARSGNLSNARHS